MKSIEDACGNRVAGRKPGGVEYEIDGAVVKLNSLRERAKLGARQKRRAAVAYKYPPERKRRNS
jgi:DNA ligase (NAD+)